MQRSLLFLTFMTVALLSSPNFVAAQESTGSEQEKALTPANVFGGFFGESMQTQITEMATKVIDGYLDFLAKPQTAKKLATFQKNYYDALIEQGFTKEQAFELLL